MYNLDIKDLQKAIKKLEKFDSRVGCQMWIGTPHGAIKFVYPKKFYGNNKAINWFKKAIKNDHETKNKTLAQS